METRANYAIVGLFTVLVLFAAFGFVYWMTNVGNQGQVAELRIRIPGSANGLSSGSPVRFNGITVGTVRGLSLDETDPSYVLARTEVRADAPVTEATNAVLEIQGLTGSAYIELSAGDVPGDQSILREAIATGEPAQLTADRSSINNLLATADQILERANSMVGELEGFVTDAREPLTNTLRNTETFSQALTNNADGIDAFLESVAALSETFNGLSGRLDTTFAAAEELLTSVDPEKVDSILTNVDSVTSNLSQASSEITQIAGSFRETSAQFSDTVSTTLERVDSIATNIDTIVAGIDGQQLTMLLENFVSASDSARQALADTREITSRFGERGEDVDQFITDVTQAANTLNAISTRVDGVVAKVDTALGDAEVADLLADVDTAVNAFRDLAVAIDAGVINQAVGDIASASQSVRDAAADTREITSRFSGRGEDVEQFITDVTQAANTLNAISTRVDGVVAKVDTALGDAEVADLLANVDTAVVSIRELATAIDAATINQAVGDIASASQSVRDAAADTQRITGRLSAREGDIDKFVDDVTQTAEQLNATAARVDGVVSKVDTALDAGEIETLVAEINSAVGAFGDLTRAVDPASVNGAVEDIAAASRSVRGAAEDTQRVTEQFGDREEDIDRFISDITQMAERLNAASVRVDGVLAKVDGFLGEGDASALLVEAEETIQAFRAVANSVNTRVGPIGDNLERFSSSGLRDVQALIAETRRSIARIESSITSIEQNPQRLIFGGDDVKQFDGRTRR